MQTHGSMNDLAWKISSCGQLALLIEASAPKPGNVSRINRFSDTEYRHYLSSAAQAGKGIFRAAQTGVWLAEEKLDYNQSNLGELILLSEKEALGGLAGQNTIFGAILLLIPLTVALSSSIAHRGEVNSVLVEECLGRLIENTTVEDAIAFSRSFEMIDLRDYEKKHDRDWNEIHERYDMTNSGIRDNIRMDKLTLGELLRISAPIDPLCREISESYPLVLHELYPRLSSMSQAMEQIEEAVVKIFIWLLSERVDGHILRKEGLETAQLIREKARETISSYDLDQNLAGAVAHLEESLPSGINPGTTADFIAGTIMYWLVDKRFLTSQ